MRRIGMLALVWLLAASPAFAASEDAWEEFRKATEAACRSLVQVPPGGMVTVEVNPFGSERFGVALLAVRLPDGSTDRMACVREKQGGKAELTAPFAGTDWPAAD